MKLAIADQRQDLYPDRHLNIFVAYRSHALDYNVTRALISTLRWSRPELTTEFLQAVAGLESVSGPFHYDLQDCDYEDFDAARVEQQAVLGISVSGKLATNLPPLDDPNQNALMLATMRSPLFMNAAPDVKVEQMRAALSRPELDMNDLAVLYHTLEELEDGCAPDGWVLSNESGGACLLIEAKLTELLDLSQMQRYADVYFDQRYEADDFKLATWADVATFFAEHRDDEDPRTAFLCGQLHDYLDLLGLAPFDGFKPYDFDLDAAREALPKFLKFAQTVCEKAGEDGLPLGAVHLLPTGTTIDLSGTPGELRLELRDDGVRLEYTCGSNQGELPGREAVDAILAATEDGAQNPLTGYEVENITVRVERLRSESADGEAWVELQTLKEELDAEHFGDVLYELRRQHPVPKSAQGATGQYRRGKLSFGRVISPDVAVGDAGDLINEVLIAVRDVVGIARKLLPTPEVAEVAEVAE